jgi:HEPN domain-containing protein
MQKIVRFSLVTPDQDAAEDLLKTAERHLTLAEKELRDDHADSVAHSCKAIEFSAKGLLVMGGVKYPREHDVGVGLVLVWKALVGSDKLSLQSVCQSSLRL